MVTKLSVRSKCWFAFMGSQEIWKLTYRQGYAFIGCIGSKSCQESRAIPPTESVSVTRVCTVNALTAAREAHQAYELAQAEHKKAATTEKEAWLDAIKEHNLKPMNLT